MSKYAKLWDFIGNCGKDSLKLSFTEIESAAGVPLDHSFLSFKKELLQYGYCVKKISLKEKSVFFEKYEAKK